MRGEVRRERHAPRLAGETREGLLDLGDVAVSGRAVRLHSLAAAPRGGGSSPRARARHPDSATRRRRSREARRATRLGQRREGEDRSGRVAPGIRNPRGAGDRLARELGQAIGPVGRLAEVRSEVDDRGAHVRERIAERGALTVRQAQEDDVAPGKRLAVEHVVALGTSLALADLDRRVSGQQPYQLASRVP